MSLAFDVYLSDLDDFILDAELDLELDMELEVYAAFGYAEGLEHDDIEHWENDAYHAFMGTFRSDAEFAESLLDEDEIPTFIQPYIEWDRVARDLMNGNYTEQENHYFRTNY